MKTILAALILCLLTLSPALAAQKGIGTSCNSDNSTVDFDTIAQCNGSTIIKAPLMLGAVANPPYASTACDAAKAGMLQYTGGVVQYCNGSAWSTMGSSSGTGGQSMVSGWPDAIKCIAGGQQTNIYYLDIAPFSDTRYWYRNPWSGGSNDVIFNADGTWYSSYSTTDCDSKTMSTLIATGHAFNFVNGGANGAAAMADGTAGAPGLYFSADTNTGVYRPTTDNLAIATGGVERLRVTATGSVGIGTASPSYPLTVSSSGLITASIVGTGAPISGLLHLENTNATTSWNLGIETGTGWGGGANGTLYIDRNTVGPMVAITPAGNVGIGTTTPSYNLHVSGDIATNNRLYLTSGFPATSPTTMCTSNGGYSGYIGYCSSDRRLKTNIDYINEKIIHKVMLLQPAEFNFKTEPDSNRQVGFIAQDVKEILPLAVGGDPDSEKMLSFSPGNLMPYAIKAIQELKSENDALRAEIKAKDAVFAARLDALEARGR